MFVDLLLIGSRAQGREIDVLNHVAIRRAIVHSTICSDNCNGSTKKFNFNLLQFTYTICQKPPEIALGETFLYGRMLRQRGKSRPRALDVYQCHRGQPAPTSFSYQVFLGQANIVEKGLAEVRRSLYTFQPIYDDARGLHIDEKYAEHSRDIADLSLMAITSFNGQNRTPSTANHSMTEVPGRKY
jgi:hypothetical protein